MSKQQSPVESITCGAIFATGVVAVIVYIGAYFATTAVGGSSYLALWIAGIATAVVVAFVILVAIAALVLKLLGKG